MKDLIQCLNRVFSGLYLTYILLIIPYVGKHVIEVLDSEYLAGKASLVLYFTSVSSFLMFAVHGSQSVRFLFSYDEKGKEKLHFLAIQFEKLFDFIFENQKRFVAEGTPECELSLYVTRLKRSMKGMGIQGGNFFTINFRFLGTVC